ncbi:MAG: thioredoxin domain-containing protein [Candidatus Saccharibacteria bacterium]|nr:thioredoxin domain-containing protein [Candidatus Saccharibacteria bacterium]
MNNKFLIVMAVLVIGFFGFLYFNRDTENGNSGGEVTSHTYGQGNSGVTVVEYGDFECAACSQYYPIFTQLKQEYEETVTFQYRHFPLVAIHQNAMAAHRAAEAAGLQGMFWEMHDTLFERQRTWETNASSNPGEIFEGYAEEIGLDMEQFSEDVRSSEVNASIQADLDAGRDLGVSGTPTFVVNDEVIDTPGSIDEFREIIDEAVAEQQ